MVTIDEQRTLQLDAAEANERFWKALSDMLAERADGHKRLVKKAHDSITRSESAAADARIRAAVARERIERLQNGEPVAGSIYKAVDVLRVLRDAGWAPADIEHARVVGALPESAVGTVASASFEAGQQAEKRTARRVARQLLEELASDDRQHDERANNEHTPKADEAPD